MRRRIRTASREAGQTAIEFALAVPFLMAFVFFITDTALVGYSYVSVTNAVREGARCAAVGGTDAAVTQRVSDTSGGLGSIGSVSVSPSPGSRSIGSSVQVSGSYTYNWITPVNILPGINVSPLQFTKSVAMRMETANIDKAVC